MTDECVELKNIKYKTMLLSPNGNIKEDKKKNILNIDDIINNDKFNNEKIPWNRLNKTIKLIKINKFIEEYCKTNKLNEVEKKNLEELLYDSLNKRMLQKTKDITYDKNTETIKNIPNLIFNKNLKKFTIKNTEKRVSPLRSLAPKSKKKTAKNKSDKNKSDKDDKGNKINSKDKELNK
tara:strand:+ start:611 stop:1147 length:537 start_codon:yes stop_codon:yes gene_type:complete